MDVTEIKKLMEVLNQTDVTEITLESDGAKILLKKDMNRVLKNKSEEKTEKVQVEETEKEEIKIQKLISLNVGKFYYMTKDGKKLAAPGMEIKEGQVVGYIESVGIKTDVKSDKSAVIKEILVENGGNVEFGQPIVAIELK